MKCWRVFVFDPARRPHRATGRSRGRPRGARARRTGKRLRRPQVRFLTFRVARRVLLAAREGGHRARLEECAREMISELKRKK